jgi:hypothetical protein
MTSLHLIGDSISIDYHPALLDALGETFTYSRLQGIEAARKDLDQPVFANGGSSTRVKTLVHDWMASGRLTDLQLGGLCPSFRGKGGQSHVFCYRKKKWRKIPMS